MTQKTNLSTPNPNRFKIYKYHLFSLIGNHLNEVIIYFGDFMIIKKKTDED